LQQKLQETQSTCEMLVAQHRRARIAGKAVTARAIAGAQHKSSTLNRLRSSILEHEATNTAAHSILDDDSLEDKFAALDREERVERLLQELKSRQPRLA
jgi:phage shock protein A